MATERKSDGRATPSHMYKIELPHGDIGEYIISVRMVKGDPSFPHIRLITKEGERDGIYIQGTEETARRLIEKLNRTIPRASGIQFKRFQAVEEVPEESSMEERIEAAVAQATVGYLRAIEGLTSAQETFQNEINSYRQQRSALVDERNKLREALTALEQRVKDESQKKVTAITAAHPKEFPALLMQFIHTVPDGLIDCYNGAFANTSLDELLGLQLSPEAAAEQAVKELAKEQGIADYTLYVGKSYIPFEQVQQRPHTDQEYLKAKNIRADIIQIIDRQENNPDVQKVLKEKLEDTLKEQSAIIDEYDTYESERNVYEREANLAKQLTDLHASVQQEHEKKKKAMEKQLFSFELLQGRRVYVAEICTGAHIRLHVHAGATESPYQNEVKRFMSDGMKESGVVSDAVLDSGTLTYDLTLSGEKEAASSAALIWKNLHAAFDQTTFAKAGMQLVAYLMPEIKDVKEKE